MLCGGMTVCSPLQRYEAKGKDVGISESILISHLSNKD